MFDFSPTDTTKELRKITDYLDKPRLGCYLGSGIGAANHDELSGLTTGQLKSNPFANRRSALSD